MENEIVEEFGELTSPNGARHFRIATRGRAKHWDLDVDIPSGDYLIQTWPSGGPSMIREIKATDGVWLNEE